MKKLLFIIFLAYSIQALQAQCMSVTNYTLNSSGNGNSVTAADFNNDGFKDLAVDYTANSYPYVRILAGSVTNHFTVASTMGFAFIGRLASADFDNDNNQDLVMGWYDSIGVMLGNGHCNFGAITLYSVGANQSKIITTDFNNDSSADVAALTPSINSFSILLGTGSGGNLSQATSYTLSGSPQDLIAKDFNNDGNIDLAVVTTSVSILLGTGTGTFASPISFTSYAPYALDAADFNGDNKLDLAVVNYSNSTISVHLGNGNGHFTFDTVLTNGSWGAKFITCGDYNNDGKADIAVGNNNFNTIYFYNGRGNGAFYLSSNSGNFSTPGYMISSDLNNDHKPDIVMADLSSIDYVLMNCSAPPACSAYVTDSLFNVSPLNWDLLAHYSPQITSATWYWGDSTSTTGFYPSHTYTAAGNYKICVKAYTSCGDSINTCRTDSIYRMANSNNSMLNVNIVATAPATTGINQNNTQSFVVYPNPSHSLIYVTGISNQNQIVIYNALGETVLQTNSKSIQQQIDISSLPNGVYFIRAGCSTQKLLKQ